MQWWQMDELVQSGGHMRLEATGAVELHDLKMSDKAGFEEVCFILLRYHILLHCR